MRAADADREAVADRLRAALGEGRLDLHEYDERLQRAYAARTYAELDVLLADLPPVTPTQGSALAPAAASAPAPASPTGDPGGQPGPAGGGVTARWLAEVWLPYLNVITVVVTIWAVTSLLNRDLLYFWPVWVAGPWGAVLVVRTITGLTGGEPRRHAIERARRKQRRQAKRAHQRELGTDGPDESEDPRPAG
ncbi:DUF1707 SHOCT-like domain-containing protein [Micromonospora vulcania]|uniref:DUF1707 domain-containing protein n=1 Tax=Micromonospora vulcania TaxID=1441873 RepID=A0ABW1GX03_9ACTN